MSRRASGIPQTPLHNDDALERSLRRQQSSTRGHSSIADVARRVQDSPLHKEPGVNRRQPSGLFPSASISSQTSQVAPGDFQEWMKMVRMKRVKANNAFAIQLIDAFHSMVQGEILSSDGQNVTFQEATHTLGGCLTVYKNRIARVKDDTSKLLVGVSEKNAAEKDDANHSDSEDEGGTDAPNSPTDTLNKKKKKQRAKRDIENDACLAPSRKLEIDVNELATSIDPLLRKMSADFDKRGAVALLQYSLKLDSQGRLLLDTEAQDIDNKKPGGSKNSQVNSNIPQSTSRLPGIVEEEEFNERNNEPLQDLISDYRQRDEPHHEDPSHGSESPSIDASNADELELAHFNVTHFANIDLNHRETLPLVDSIAKAVANPDTGTEELIRDMQAWAIVDPGDSSAYRIDNHEGPENEYNESETGSQTSGALDNDFGLDGFGGDLGDLGDQFDANFDDPATDVPLDNENSSELSLNSVVSSRLPTSGNWMDIDYLQKLDLQNANWAGPSFWKVRRLHAKHSEQSKATDVETASGQKLSKASRRNAATIPPIIDFNQESDVDIDNLFSPGTRTTLLSTKQYDLTNKHLLPVDMHVTTSQLVNLHLRPKTGLAPAFRRGAWKSSLENTLDLSSADHSNINQTMDLELDNVEEGNRRNEDDYFYEGWDDFGGDTAFRPSTASAMFTQNTQTGYGVQNSQLNFSRVAKRIDVRRLKDNVWRAIQKEDEVAIARPSSPSHANTDSPSAHENVPRAATLLKVIHDTQPLYSDQQRSDLSPAMYFISLLHLSNEKGLSLENTESLTDIRIIPQTVSSLVD